MVKIDMSHRANKILLQPRRMKDLFARRNAGSMYLLFTWKLLRLLLKLGIKPRVDGWRKYATAFLRTEDTRFLLAVFRLKVELGVGDDDVHITSKQWIIEQLAHFFSANPQLWNTRLEWNRSGASIQPNNHLDFVWAEFDNGGNLSTMRVFRDVDKGLSLDDSASLYSDFFVQAYNKTILAGRQRPYHLLVTLQALLKNAVYKNTAIDFAQRVLDSVFIHFESIESDEKLDFPDFSIFPHPGGGAFNISCRLQSPDYNEVDLWFHIHHALCDGNPVLEALNDQKRTWGTTGAMVFPPIAQGNKTYTCVEPTHNDSGRDLVYAHQHISFEHLLEERKRLNQKYRRLLKNKITIAGMVLWGLSNQPFMKDSKITLIVDVPLNSRTGEPRTLGFITSKPNEVVDENDTELSFVRYQTFINDAIEWVRKREDQTYIVLECQALMPAISYEMSLALVPHAVRDVGGTVSLTLMPLADYCTPPADDTKDAIIAIGNIMMPTKDGKLAGAVCIKSVKDDVGQYWESIYNTITQWHI